MAATAPSSIKSDASASGEFKIGGELPVHRLGYGAMRITGKGIWGEPENPEEAVRVLQRIPELGINFIDTANSYGPEVSERLIGDTLAPYANGLVVATKVGLTRQGPDQWLPVARPEIHARVPGNEPAPPQSRYNRLVPAAPYRRESTSGRPIRRAAQISGRRQSPAS